MSITSQQYASLAEDSYRRRKPGERVTLEGVTYKIIEHAENRINGYQGTIYQRTDTGAIVVAHRGTQVKDGLIETLKDGALTDGGMLLARTNAQVSDAIKLVNNARSYAHANLGGFYPPAQVTVTGHSLGGCLAQITAHKLNLKGETFNAYGAVSLNQRIPEGGDNLVNHVMAADPISAASRHFGRVHVYATPEEVRQLKTAGYDNNRNPLQVRSLGSAVAVSLDSHFMDNFLNVDAYNKPDKSVLADPHARQLAANFDPAIDRYRSDIAFARGLITFVANNPVGNLQESISTLRGDETPGELLRRQERLDRALRFEASHGIADSRRPLPERESPYRPELVRPGGPLSLPEYLPRQDDASRPPLKSDDVPRSKGMPLSAIPVGHPDHALYTELKQQLPAGTSEDRLAQITVAAKLGGVTAGQLQGVHVSEQSMQVFVAGTIPGQRCCVDLRAPPPALEESLRHSEVFDHQQAQQLTQLQVHQQNLNALGQSGPSMTMG